MTRTTKYYLLGLTLIATSCGQIDNKNSNTTRTDTTMGKTVPPLNDSNSFVFQSKTIDTLVNVGNHKLHFRIFKGKGIPILFEAGAGDDGMIWDTILKPLSEITGATLVTYDRAGFGNSTIDKMETNNSKHGILSGLDDLEVALKILGYDKEIMLVSHSYGGYYTTLYSERHPSLVKSIVLIDVSHDFHEKYAENEVSDHEKETTKLKNTNLGFYYLAVNFFETSKLMSNHTIPKSIPVVDFVDGISFQEDKEKTEHWKECHKIFVDSHPKSIGITAYGCGHYIWLDNPSLVITTIAKSYAETLEEKQKINIYNQALNYANIQDNEKKQKIKK